MLFDTHLDILFDVVRRRKNGERNIIKQYHLPELTNYTGVAATMYFEGNNEVEELDEALKYIIDEVEDAKDVVNFIYSLKDLEKNDGKIKMILAIEGLACLRTIDDLKKIWNAGIRQISLTWNDQNLLGSGSYYTEGGLTTLGEQVVKLFISWGGIIDISHANQKTAKMILDIASSNVFASHSNAFSVFPHPRNLTDEIIMKIAKREGLVSLTPAFFIGSKEERTLDKLVDHIDYMKNLIGINYLSIGTDFLSFLPDYSGAIIPELKSPKDGYLIIEALRKRNYSEEEIEKIAYKNYYEFLKRSLK